MKGYVARKRDRWYTVIYEGLDPVTGRERRSWHAAATVRADAERLAARLAHEHEGRNDPARSTTFGLYLTMLSLRKSATGWSASSSIGVQGPRVVHALTDTLRTRWEDTSGESSVDAEGALGVAPRELCGCARRVLA
jgi:hypothetical protein